MAISAVLFVCYGHRATPKGPPAWFDIARVIRRRGEEFDWFRLCGNATRDDVW